MNEIIYISDEEVSYLANLASTIANKKKDEHDYKIDGQNISSRFLTGLMGEFACEKLFNINIIDWECGSSKKYNKPDLQDAGFNIGIKTFKKNNKYPIIYKQNTYPQIICKIIDKNHVQVLGLATVDVLNEFQDDSYCCYDIRKKGYKTSFTGLNNLKEVDLYEFKS